MHPNHAAMISRMKLMTFVISLFSLWSGHTLAAGHPHKNHQSLSKARIQLPEKTKKDIIGALVANESLHLAFFDYKGVEVEKASAHLASQLEKIRDPKISKLMKFSKDQLSHMTAKKSKSENSESYHIVSMALIYLVNKYDIGSTYNAYSCPMVKKKWVQNSEKKAKVHNPYDSSMPHCGSQDTSY